MCDSASDVLLLEILNNLELMQNTFEPSSVWQVLEFWFVYVINFSWNTQEFQ